MGHFNVTFSENDSEFTVDMEEDNSDFNVDINEAYDIKPISVNHNELKNRDAQNAHPLSSITGLEEQIENLLQKIQQMQSAMPTEEEKASWNNKSRVYRDASGTLVVTH